MSTFALLTETAPSTTAIPTDETSLFECGKASAFSKIPFPVRAGVLKQVPPTTVRSALGQLGAEDTTSVLPSPRLEYKYILLQRWEGMVLELHEDTFRARLKDLTNPENEEEVAEFSRDEVSPDDQSIIEPGSLFFWNIGYKDAASGQRTRASELRFRRFPVWTAVELRRAREHATRLKKELGW